MTSLSSTGFQSSAVFFTHDDNFLAIANRWQTAGRPFSGITYGTQYRLTIRQLIVELGLIAKAADPADFSIASSSCR